MNKYDHKVIEKKWQQDWLSRDLYKANDFDSRTKFYGLIEFPFPSGEGLHTGHIKSNTAMDIICRKRRMEKFNVLYSIGWDAFGLPTENYAIKTGIHPKIVTKKNTDRFRTQLKSCGFSFDWSREINTSDPEYYKWTQWIFLQLFKKGLAYKNKQPINWCPSCKIGLANEESVDNICDRCGGRTEVKEKEQWMLAITKYADRLYNDLDTVEYLEKIKVQQKNWIGKSEGALIKFKVVLESSKNLENIEVFTTRPDTLFGVTYVVLAPEHKLVSELLSSEHFSNKKDVEAYIARAKNETEIERTDATKEKTGVELKGIFAINPANKEKVSVWISDYVLADYGTGAVMAVPAHDERDWNFAKKFGLKMGEVISGGDINKKAYIENGKLINSNTFNGKDSESVKKEITDFVGGKWVTKYKLRDWVFSRQRYWGEPIPIVHCEKCGIVPVDEGDLPVILPEVEKYEPTDTGESPLAYVHDWVNTKCSKCHGPAKRETDTMPNWAGSSWYFLRYIDPHNNKKLADIDKLRYWMNVDWYNGGMEHTTLHLLYSRFWHKFLYDIGAVTTMEPYNKRTSHGFILGEGGVKMSKSKGNVVNPDDIIDLYGADTLRIYEMFMGPFDQTAVWSTESIVGSRRFIDKVWKLSDKVSGDHIISPTTETLVNCTIKKVSEDIEMMRFNTAISSLMILVGEFEKRDEISISDFSILIKLLAPFAPHITEELWHKIGNNDSIHISDWPIYDKNKLIKNNISVAVQIDGKTRTVLEFLGDVDQHDVEKKVVDLDLYRKIFSSKKPSKVIYIKNKIINFVT